MPSAKPHECNPSGVLADLRRRAELSGGEDRLRRQRESRLTARERIEQLFDHACRVGEMVALLDPTSGGSV